MAALRPTLCLLLLLGMWAIPDHGRATRTQTVLDVRLTGGSCNCTGIVEVRLDKQWIRMCWGTLNKAVLEHICQRVSCGPPISEALQLVIPSGKEPHMLSKRCRKPMGELECNQELENCTQHAMVACRGPPRLRLVDGSFICSGFVELHKEGLWGAVANESHIWPRLATRICQALSCGTAIHNHSLPQLGVHLPVRWEVVDPCESNSLLECFNRSSVRRGRAPAFITCSGSQPRALHRLAAGPTLCEGDIEVFHGGRWQVLCDSRTEPCT
ncbi:PREDICTED: T-cell surface glycoprotein CD5, partial [Acanthisitta chloris]|uniref:T-cell surface glycoprotein CD5 n=1 Tax=Acanthisitta chloris TaxID=57068 RepID=UPI0004F0FB50